MTVKTIAPYGSWKSPISVELVVAGGVDLRQGLGQCACDGDDVYWSEGRPAEGGRNALVRRSADGTVTDVLPPGWSARSRVHEYGGGEFAVSAGVVYFVNDADQQLYRLRMGAAPEALTASPALRFADPVIDQRRGRLVCVCEDHVDAGCEPANRLVSIELQGGRPPAVVRQGDDFYAAPRLSPDGTRLAWLAWRHPNMPWDGTTLYQAGLTADGGDLHQVEPVAGGDDESIVQPEWSPDGVLHFVSDRSGWWNLYRWRDGQVEALCAMEAEFGVPLWSLGTSTYGFASAEHLVCAYAQAGAWRLAYLHTGSKRLESIVSPYSDIGNVRAGSGRVVFRGGSPNQPLSIVAIDLASGVSTVLRCSKTVPVDSAYVALPEPIAFPTGGGATAYGLFYPPTNRDFDGPPDELPPLVVISHGGPTAATSTALDMKVQYWTSRGIAVLDVNYRGSSGYGRAYRRSLDGQWGMADVEDCVRGAQALAAARRVDGGRLAIRGSSAGGYTTLCALTFHDVFRVGASYYGISDLEALATDTHKFESRYLDRLIGPYPQRRDAYRQRSPIHYTDRLSCPVILFQGLDDRVVPPSQAECFVAALRAKGLPVAYVPFAGEQHGFRRAETVRRALEAELYFYARVLGFALADDVEPVAIENLSARGE